MSRLFKYDHEQKVTASNPDDPAGKKPAFLVTVLSSLVGQTYDTILSIVDGKFQLLKYHGDGKEVAQGAIWSSTSAAQQKRRQIVMEMPKNDVQKIYNVPAPEYLIRG